MCMNLPKFSTAVLLVGVYSSTEPHHTFRRSHSDEIPSKFEKFGTGTSSLLVPVTKCVLECYGIVKTMYIYF
jgi:hypothetical protein